MAKLNKAERKDVASLFNSIIVANIMINDALKERDHDKFDRWSSSKRVDTIALYEQYGIELPMLQDYLNDAA